jgi:DNA recombination protein RmuC
VPRKRAERWGEIPLRRVVELAGVAEHCHFDGPIDVASADGRYRPDAIVRLPGMRAVVIDARAPLAAYLASLEADDESHRRSMLRVHAARMRDHASQLGSPAYRAHLSSPTDLVILYLPLEGALSGAIEEDSGLVDYALGYSVLPASPLTLFAHLKAAAWLGASIDRSAV